MSRVTLLDVNVLVALFDPEHLHHEAAHSWFEKNRSSGWATCPITENGLVRVLSNTAYGPGHEPASGVLHRLRRFCESGGHESWPDDVSLLTSGILRSGAALTHARITDVYLLALAVAHGGRLATFDRRIPLAAVAGAERGHFALMPA